VLWQTRQLLSRLIMLCFHGNWLRIDEWKAFGNIYGTAYTIILIEFSKFNSYSFIWYCLKASLQLGLNFEDPLKIIDPILV